MEDAVSVPKLRSSIGRRVEVLAFGMSYVGILKKIDQKNGLIRVEDEKDYVVLEIERIENFRVLRR